MGGGLSTGEILEENRRTRFSPVQISKDFRLQINQNFYDELSNISTTQNNKDFYYELTEMTTRR